LPFKAVVFLESTLFVCLQKRFVLIFCRERRQFWFFRGK
jgi:hypothetical protein